MRSARAALKMLGFIILSLLIVPPQLVVLCFTKGKGAYFMPWLWHKIMCFIFSIKFEIVGKPNISAQTIFMSNHLSYLDIPLIGSLLKASFVAKSEVAKWPVFGFLSELQQTAFIERKKTAILRSTSSLQGRIQAGKSLIIFPEGTSTDGCNVLPFKSSLFSLALPEQRHDLFVQPMTLQLLKVDGRAIQTQDDRNLYTWHNDMDTSLAAHLWRFAKTSGAKLRLTFHPPLRTAEYQDRKVLAKICHDNVSKGLQEKERL